MKVIIHKNIYLILIYLNQHFFHVLIIPKYLLLIINILLILFYYLDHYDQFKNIKIMFLNVFSLNIQ